jgi:hypothetical protein
MNAIELLATLPRGPENGTDMGSLAECCGVAEREIRDLCRELVITHHKPVNTKGSVYLARNWDELKPTVRDYWKRFVSLKERMDALLMVTFDDSPQTQLPV